jgi:hypothetical protein
MADFVAEMEMREASAASASNRLPLAPFGSGSFEQLH